MRSSWRFATFRERPRCKRDTWFVRSAWSIGLLPESRADELRKNNRIPTENYKEKRERERERESGVGLGEEGKRHTQKTSRTTPWFACMRGHTAGATWLVDMGVAPRLSIVRSVVQ